jgi:nitrate/TMAO reductase-like tetraheme cytochrome c subunit
VNTNNKIRRYKKTIVVLSITGSCILFVTTCVDNSGRKEPAIPKQNTYKQFAGSQVCASCHKDIYQKHLLTEHHLTSAEVTPKNILGSFKAGSNVFRFGPIVNVTMEEKGGEFYQVQYSNGAEVKKEKFDIVVGSGRKGQSYLSWRGNHFVQLPITYFTPAKQWSNSPGYNPHLPTFNRPITSRCLECHSTYFVTISDPSKKFEEYDQNKIIYGVDCEKCHGPAADHVQFHSTHPDVTTGKNIVNPAKLSRQRLLDLCTLCHGGALSKTKPSFSFQAGDTLSNYFSMQAAMINADNIDVHGNQFGLMALSKCFKMSNLTCLSCHNVHENENGKTKLFSQRCVSCHNSSHGNLCKLTATIGSSITQNCIDCHMPKQMSHAVAVYLQGNDIPTSALMRTHYIKIYPDETKTFLKELEHLKKISK